MLVQRRWDVDRLLDSDRGRLLASARRVLRINITILQPAVGVAGRIADNGKKQGTSKPLPPMRINIAIDTGAAERIGRRRWGSVVISTLIHAKGILQVTGNT